MTCDERGELYDVGFAEGRAAERAEQQARIDAAIARHGWDRARLVVDLVYSLESSVFQRVLLEILEPEGKAT